MIQIGAIIACLLKNERVIIYLYVNELLIFSTDIDVISSIKIFFSCKFEKKDLGEAYNQIKIKIKISNR